MADNPNPIFTENLFHDLKSKDLESADFVINIVLFFLFISLCKCKGLINRFSVFEITIFRDTCYIGWFESAKGYSLAETLFEWQCRVALIII